MKTRERFNPMFHWNSISVGLPFFVIVSLLLPANLDAQVDKSTPKNKAVKKNDSEDKDKEKPSEKKPEYLLIRGADILTVTQGRIRQGSILVKDGKIEAVGKSIDVPEGAEILDASGKTICPGFVAITMSGIGIRSTPSGSNKLQDAIDPYDQNMKYALGIGITTGCVQLSTSSSRRFGRNPGEPDDIFPGLETPMEEFLTEQMIDYGDPNTALCPCCGLPVLPTEPIDPVRPSTAKPRKMSVIKLAYGNVESIVSKENVFYNPAPGSLNGALNRHNWRLEIKKAKDAIKAEKDAVSKKTTTSTSKSGSGSKSSSSSKSSSTTKRTTSSKPKANADVVALLKGETRMRVRCDAYDEISDLAAMAQLYGYDLVVEGGTEAWVAVDQISKAGVSVIYTPRRRRTPVDGRRDSSGSNFVSPLIFEEAGIPFAITPLSSSISMGGLAGRDLTSLPLEAAFAIRGGASEKTALESLTITPARMMGMEDKIGSIEVGKDADLLILNGEPLDYKTYVEQAVVAGKVCYDRAKDRVFPVYPRED